MRNRSNNYRCRVYRGARPPIVFLSMLRRKHHSKPASTTHISGFLLFEYREALARAQARTQYNPTGKAHWINQLEVSRLLWHEAARTVAHRRSVCWSGRCRWKTGSGQSTNPRSSWSPFTIRCIMWNRKSLLPKADNIVIPLCTAGRERAHDAGGAHGPKCSSCDEILS